MVRSPSLVVAWALATGLLAPGAIADDAARAPSATAAPAAGRAGEKAGRDPELAGTRAAAPEDEAVVATEEGAEGVKTYKFGAVEVEGRLRSPQIIYFLRRVRAQFESGGLGHRSFLRELSDTRRHPAIP